MIKAFPKIFHIGTDYIRNIFSSEVEITEKIDGSQFDFGKINGTLYMRSRGKQLFPEAPEAMFREGIQYIESIQDKLPDNTIFYCEYLKQPKHNTLKYSRIPRNHLALFGISDQTDKFRGEYSALIDYAEEINIEVVSLIFRGIISDINQLKEMLLRKSVLGGSEIEGIVVKNYDIPFLLGGQPIPIMSGKYVSEKFKEVHNKNWKGEFTTKGKMELFLEGFRTEARWNKAIQHLAESGELENSPRDIGSLIKEIQRDIEAEEKENIKNFLWNEFRGQIMRKAIAGFPEWYKQRLMENSFGN